MAHLPSWETGQESGPVRILDPEEAVALDREISRGCGACEAALFGDIVADHGTDPAGAIIARGADLID
jgi:hypothetical protein